jgi:histidyl-tRNA synthetase
MEQLQPAKGTQDFLADQYDIFLHIVGVARQISNNFAYREIAVPIFEYTEIFKRSLGDASDIVSKEMYTFDDKKGRSLTLRPEFTASIIRSFIANSVQTLPYKVFSFGPLFRYERPQKGRYRQFHQVNFENIGSKGPTSDAEIILLAHHFLHRLGLTGLKLEINTLGDTNTRHKYREALTDYFSKYRHELSEDSKIRLEKNPLRILDSKDDSDKKLITSAPKIKDFLTTASQNFFDSVLSTISALGIPYNVNQSLVRGLDYYTDTVFEFTTDKLGSQNAVLAGGRYDNLVKQMGGADIPAIGFGSGIERLMELSQINIKASNKVYIFVLDEQKFTYSLKLAHKIRSLNISTELVVANNVNKSMKKALNDNAKFIVFIGDEEVHNNNYKLKNIETREEQTLALDELIKRLGEYEF